MRLDRHAAVAKNIRLTDQEPANCIVRGDPERLQQIFWNLLSNAVKFTPAGGVVNVEIAREPGSITVAVVDSGLGLPLNSCRSSSIDFGRPIKPPPGRTEDWVWACRS